MHRKCIIWITIISHGYIRLVINESVGSDIGLPVDKMEGRFVGP